MSIGSTLKSLSDRFFGTEFGEPEVAMNATQLKAGLIQMRNKVVSYTNTPDFEKFNGALAALDVPDTMTQQQLHDVLKNFVDQLSRRGFIDDDIQAYGSEMFIKTMLNDIEHSLNNTDHGELALNAIRFDQIAHQYSYGGRDIGKQDFDDNGLRH